MRDRKWKPPGARQAGRSRQNNSQAKRFDPIQQAAALKYCLMVERRDDGAISSANNPPSKLTVFGGGNLVKSA
jgi:hypothetical protein